MVRPVWLVVCRLFGAVCSMRVRIVGWVGSRHSRCTVFGKATTGLWCRNECKSDLYCRLRCWRKIHLVLRRADRQMYLWGACSQDRIVLHMRSLPGRWPLWVDRSGGISRRVGIHWNQPDQGLYHRGRERQTRYLWILLRLHPGRGLSWLQRPWGRPVRALRRRAHRHSDRCAIPFGEGRKFVPLVAHRRVWGGELGERVERS